MPSIANQKDVLERMPDAPKRFVLFGALAAAVLMAMIGGFAWVHDRGTALFDEVGRPVKMHGVWRKFWPNCCACRNTSSIPH